MRDCINVDKPYSSLCNCESFARLESPHTGAGLIGSHSFGGAVGYGRGPRIEYLFVTVSSYGVQQRIQAALCKLAQRKRKP